MEKQNCKLAIKLALVDLIYGMNRNTSLKLNLVIIAVQFMMLFISMILQITIKESKVGVSLMNSLWSIAMMFVAIINIKIISHKAMTKAKEQRDMIEILLDKLSEDERENNESHK